MNTFCINYAIIISFLYFGAEYGLEEHFEKGKAERNIEIAKNLLIAGVDIQVISTSTGLPKEEIEKLKAKLNHYRLRAGRLMVGTKSAVEFKLKLIPI